MNRRRLLLSSAYALGTPFLVACGPSAKEQEVIRQLVESMRPFAFSRYVIDLPAGFAITTGSRVILTYGLTADFVTTEVEVLETSADKAKLKALVANRAAQFAGEQHEKLKSSMLAANLAISETASLLRRFDDYSLTEYFNCELYALVGDTIVLAKASVYNNNIAPVEARLTRLLSQMTRPAGTAQAGKGFMLGPVLIDTGHDQERSLLTLHDATQPDVWVQIYTTAISVDPEKSLIQRGDANEPLVRAAGVTWDTLRKGQTRIAGMEADEVLIGYKQDGKTGYLFEAESRRAHPSFERQMLDIELQSGFLSGGRPAESSWSKAEMLAVWNALIKSVKLRPGAV